MRDTNTIETIEQIKDELVALIGCIKDLEVDGDESVWSNYQSGLTVDSDDLVYKKHRAAQPIVAVLWRLDKLIEEIKEREEQP